MCDIVVCLMRLRTAKETDFHSTVRKEAVALDTDIAYLPLPVVGGEDANGDPIVSLEQWPFILPHLFVSDRNTNCFLETRSFGATLKTANIMGGIPGTSYA